jgi:hypothetical protein
MSGLSKEPASGRRPVLSVPLAVWSECRRGLDRARIHARWVAIASSGVALVYGASIVILRTLPLIPSVAVVAGGWRGRLLPLTDACTQRGTGEGCKCPSCTASDRVVNLSGHPRCRSPG